MIDSQKINDVGVVNISSECFGLRDGSILCWRGQNYVPQEPQKPTLRVRLHNRWVQFMNRRR